MLFSYRLLINLVFVFSPIILIIRLFKKKEDPYRFKEKFCIFSKMRKKGKLIWFHGASVGEIQSALPIIEKFEKDRGISQILITSNTLSSSKIITKLRLKKTIHQFFPIDTNFLSEKFLNYWKPSVAIFIDTEIWPNIIKNVKKREIPLILINGRISVKTFNRWRKFPSFAKEIFGKFDLCIACSKISKKYFKKLGINNIKFFGNLKYSQSEIFSLLVNKNLKTFISKKKVWCATSTHEGEEKICATAHLKLKKKYKNLLTIIIPRHVERTEKIKKQLDQMGLKTHIHQPAKKIKNNIDIYLVNTYGQTKAFFNICKTVFLGGSIIPHGGQNPLEAARYGCDILHGPNISNFSDIYVFLKKNKIATKFNNIETMVNILNNLFLKKKKSKIIKKMISKTGNKILNLTYKEINFFSN